MRCAAIHETVGRLIPEVTGLRHELHQHPEIRFEETWTSERIARFLSEAGVPHQRGYAGGTGIVAELGTSGQRTVALRADMDALEIAEQTRLPYASKIPQRMHACGHDGHSASLCGVVKALSLHPELLKGRVKFIFQPAEEQAAGGRLIVNEGVLDDVDAVFALHAWPNIPVGQIAAGDGRVMASADFFRVEIQGKGGHGADPASAVDPVLILAHIITALQSICSRELDPWESSVVSVCRVEAGSASNVIPETALLEGTYRALRPEVRAHLAAAIDRIATQTAAAFRARVSVFCSEGGYPVLDNDPAMSAFARTCAGDVFGEDSVVPVLHPYMFAEDFAFYLQNTPGAFIFLGNRRPEDTDPPPLHSPFFDFNDNALPVAIELMSEIAIRFLGSGTLAREGAHS